MHCRDSEKGEGRIKGVGNSQRNTVRPEYLSYVQDSLYDEAYLKHKASSNIKN